MAHALLDMGLQRVVGGNAGGPVVDGLRGITNIGNAEVDVATFVVEQGACSVSQLQVAPIGIQRGVAIGVVLRVERGGG